MATAKSTKSELMLRHPSEPTKVIAYGWDGPRGYYAALFVDGKRASAIESADATRQQARHAVIKWAVELGFFTESDLDDATAALDTTRIDKLPGRLRTLVDVVLSFGILLQDRPPS